MSILEKFTMKSDRLAVLGQGQGWMSVLPTFMKSSKPQNCLASAFLSLMVTGDEVTGPINTGNPGEFTMVELAKKIIKLSGSRSEVVFAPLPQDDPRQRRPDLSLAKEKLDWEPKVMLEEGLVPTIAYFETMRNNACLRLFS